MKRDKTVTTTPRDPFPVIHYGAPRDLEAQVSLALASVRVTAGFLTASKYGTCEDPEDDEAAGEVIYRALELLDELDFSKVTMKPQTHEKE